MPKNKPLNMGFENDESLSNIEKSSYAVQQLETKPGFKKPKSKKIFTVWAAALISVSPIGLYALVPLSHGTQTNIAAKQQMVIDKELSKSTALPAVSTTMVCPTFAANALGTTTETSDAESFSRAEVGGILLSAPAPESVKESSIKGVPSVAPSKNPLEAVPSVSPSQSAAPADKTKPKQARSAWDQSASNQLLDKFGLRSIWVEPQWANGKELADAKTAKAAEAAKTTKGIGKDLYWLGNVADNSPNIFSSTSNLPGKSANAHPLYLRLNPQTPQLKDLATGQAGTETPGVQQPKENEPSHARERLQTFSVEGQRTNLVGVGSFARSDQGAMYSIAAANCQTPQMLSYLVGGSTTAGNSTRLLVHNPQTTAVTVQVEGYGSAGLLDLGGAGRLVIPPESTSSLLIESFVDEPQIAFKVFSKGGPVAAWLQVQEANGLATRGTDLVVAGSNFTAHQQIITGVVGSDSANKAAGNTKAEGNEGSISNLAARNVAGALETPVLRLVNPNSKDMTARISVYGGNGRVTLPGNDQVKVEAQSVLDLPLTGLQSGYYSVQVDSDQAVLAAVKISSRPTSSSANSNVSAGASSAAPNSTNPTNSANPSNLGKTAIVNAGENTDLTWLASAQTQSAGLLAVNSLAAQNMAIFSNPTAQETHIEITVVGADRKTQVSELTIPAEGTRAVWVPTSARALLFVVKDYASTNLTSHSGLEGVSAQLLSLQTGTGGLLISNLTPARDWEQAAGQAIYLWK